MLTPFCSLHLTLMYGVCNTEPNRGLILVSVVMLQHLIQKWGGCISYDTLFHNRVPLFRYCPIFQARYTNTRVLCPTLTSVEELSEILHARRACNCYFLLSAMKI